MNNPRRPLLAAGGSDVSDLRRRTLKRDDAIRRRIENDLLKKLRPHRPTTKHKRGAPGTVMLLRPLDPVMCKRLISAYEAAQLMAARRENCVLVVDAAGTLEGIFTAKDLAFRVAGAGKTAATITVAEIMTPLPICAYANDAAGAALTMMVERGFRHLPVLDADGQVAGVLDITRCYAQQMEKLERMHALLQQLSEALHSVHSEMGGDQPLPVHAYVEELRHRMNGPTLELVLGADTVPVYTTVKLLVYDATVLMADHHTTAVLVNDSQGAVTGIFTLKDVVLRVLAAGLDPKTCSVVRVMTPKPDVLMMGTPIQKALRQMFDGHYLNLPVVDDDGDIIGIIDVLKLTYATLNQLKHIESADNSRLALEVTLPSHEREGPAWNRFWTSFDPSGTEDLELMHSDLAAALAPEVSAAELQHFNLDIKPLDLVSYVEKRRSYVAPGSQTSAIPEEEVEHTAFVFKFRSPGSRAHRVLMKPAEGVAHLRLLVTGKLTAPEVAEVGGAEHYAISYVDDDGDVVSITTDRDLVECTRLNVLLNNLKADLYVHHPSQAAQPTHPPAKAVHQYVPGISNDMLLPIAGLLAGSAIVTYFISRKS